MGHPMDAEKFELLEFPQRTKSLPERVVEAAVMAGAVKMLLLYEKADGGFGYYGNTGDLANTFLFMDIVKKRFVP